MGCTSDNEKSKQMTLKTKGRLEIKLCNISIIHVCIIFRLKFYKQHKFCIHMIYRNLKA